MNDNRLAKAIMAIQPTGKEVQLAQVVTPPPAQAEVASAPAVLEKALPRTASTRPLIGLLSLMALGGAVVVREVAKHV